MKRPSSHDNERIAELESALARAESELATARAEGAMYRQLVEDTGEVFWVGSPDWHEVYYVSPAYARVWGRNCASLYAAPLSWLDAVHPEDRPHVERDIEVKSSGDLSQPFPRYRIVRPDGSVRWVLARAFALRDETGAVVRIAGLAEDITWLREIEDQLQRERDLAERIIETAPAIVLLLDTKGRVVRYNQVLERVSGRSLEQARGRDWCETFVPPRARAQCWTMLQGILDGADIRGVVGTVTTKRGDEREVEWHATVLRSSTGARLGVLVLGLDISERLDAQRELVALAETLEAKIAQRTAMLATSIADKEALLAELHHRVKNNMQVVSSLLYLQSVGSDDAQLRALLAVSRQRIRALSLVHEHLYRSPDFEQVDAEDYLTVLMHDLTQAMAGTAGIRVVSDIEPGIRLGIEAAWPCGLIVNEVVTNALQHAFPDGREGTIRVELSRAPSGECCMEICDDGVGLDVERMSRGDDGDSLGLRLVQSLARQLAGELEVKTATPGTCVHLRFRPT